MIDTLLFYAMLFCNCSQSAMHYCVCLMVLVFTARVAMGKVRRQKYIVDQDGSYIDRSLDSL